MSNKLYHITSIDRLGSILNDGLVANYGGEVNSGLSEDGYIYLFENKSYVSPITGDIINVADDIAQNQLFLDDYVMLEIDTDGIDEELEKDNVGEFCSFALWKVKQDKIDTDYIDLFGRFKVGEGN